MTQEVPKDDKCGHRMRLRRKFLTAGINAFHEYEVLELFLTYALPRADVKPQAKRLIEKFGSIKAVVDADIGELTAIAGVGENSAVLIKLVKEIASLYLLQKAKEKRQVSCTSELFDFCRTVLGGNGTRSSALSIWTHRIR